MRRVRFVSKEPLPHCVHLIPQLREYVAAHPRFFFLAIVWLLPGNPSHANVNLFARPMPSTVPGSPDRGTGAGSTTAGVSDDVFEPLFQVGCRPVCPRVRLPLKKLHVSCMVALLRGL